jgi:predicted transcriptional regulator of viral defense system
MNFSRLLDLIGDEPVFETSLLLAGDVDHRGVRLQLSRWVKSGRIIQLRRGLYSLAPPYQKVKPHPFLVANRLQRASYVSGPSALAAYGIIPDTVQSTFSVTTGRPGRWETPAGVFEYRHIKTKLLRGYRMINLTQTQPAQQAFVAVPEKALLDLVYLQAGGDAVEYLRELRLQNLEHIRPEELRRQAGAFQSPKMDRAVERIAILIQSENQDYKTL